MINARKKIPWLLVILWMTLIFYLSHQPVAKSNKLSTGITEKLVEVVERMDSDKNLNLGRVNHILRKNAHFFAYLILGILVVNGLRSSGMVGIKSIGLGILICVLYAISDEVHQLFVPGRGGQVKDVLIDSAGSITGIIVYKMINKNKESAQNTMQEKK
jgi:VanZ family protein